MRRLMIYDPEIMKVAFQCE